MARDVIMPALGMAQESGVLVRWLVAEGDTVAEGDPLMEVETDKAVVEVPAAASGTLAAVAYGEGAEVAVGTVLAVLLAPGEAQTSAAGAVAAAPRSVASGPAPAAVSGAGSGAASGTASGTASDTAPPRAHAAPVTAGTAAVGGTAGAAPPARTAAPGPSKAVLASPKAKRLARELGIDLAAVVGTGPAGAVRAVDLPLAGAALASDNLLDAARRGVDAGTGAPQAASADAAWLRTELDTAGLSEFLTRVTRALAHKAIASAFFTGVPSGAGAVAIGVPDVLTRALAAGLSRDATFGGQELRLRLVINGARTSAVLAGRQTSSVLEVARARAEQADTARHGPLAVEVVDSSGEDFERSPSPLDAATAVRLTLGPIKQAVAVHDGAPSVRESATLSLEYRSSALDGDRAEELFTYVGRILRDPFSLAVAG